MRKFPAFSKLLAIGLSALTLLAATSCSVNLGKTSGASVSSFETAEVKGARLHAEAQAKVTVEPDIAYLTLGATTMDEKASDAARQNAIIMEAILAAVKQAGVDEADIRTQRYNVEMDYDYSGLTPTLKGYNVSNSLNITIHDLAIVGDVLDAATKSGANEVTSLVFDKEDKSVAYDEALTLATKRAMEKVDVIAAAAGMKGKPVPKEITEVNYQTYPLEGVYQESRVAEMEGDARIPIVPGDLEISANVNVEFALGE
ncbi:MAG: SIMPL domain-containing protein [Fastidiosipilaceae bacterium]